MGATRIWTSKETEVVEKAFEDGYACDDCPHLREYRDTRWEPGGRECHLLDYQRDVPTDCPGYTRFAEPTEEQENE